MITCRLLGEYELRMYEYYLKDRNFDTRSMYFGCAITDDAIRSLVDHIIENKSQHNILVAENRELEIVGTIHIAQISDHEVELGVMVAEAYRGMKISNKMLDYALNWCRNRNYKDIYMHCLSYNAPILHLVNKYGLEVSNKYGDADARVTLPPVSIMSVTKEAIDNQRHLLQRTFNENVMSFHRLVS